MSSPCCSLLSSTFFLHIASMKSAEAWMNLAPTHQIPCRRVHLVPSEREVKAPNLDGGGDIREVPVVPEQRPATCHPASPRVSIDGNWHLRQMRLFTPSFSVFRQVYDVSLPTFRLELYLVNVAYFVRTPRGASPCSRQMNQRSGLGSVKTQKYGTSISVIFQVVSRSNVQHFLHEPPSRSDSSASTG